ncbi:MAG: hypothetical protein J5I98_15385 [Phaeodactylibacter sp.]|nr:hypothetical protein [Phaeodactylibacter sp.]
MQSKRLPILLFSILVIATCVLLFSTHSKKQNYILEGQVAFPEGSAVSLDVYVTQERGFPQDFSALHRVRTVREGRFTTEYYAEVNVPIHFYVKKDGFTPVRHTLYPRSENGKFQRLSQPILFASLHEKLGSEHYYGDKGIPKLPTYGNKCGQTPDSHIPVNEIQYVENLSYISCPENTAPNLAGDIKTDKKLFLNTFFRQLPLGQVYNAASSLSEKRN